MRALHTRALYELGHQPRTAETLNPRQQRARDEPIITSHSATWGSSLSYVNVAVKVRGYIQYCCIRLEQGRLHPFKTAYNLTFFNFFLEKQLNNFHHIALLRKRICDN